MNLRVTCHSCSQRWNSLIWYGVKAVIGCYPISHGLLTFSLHGVSIVRDSHRLGKTSMRSISQMVFSMLVKLIARKHLVADSASFCTLLGIQHCFTSQWQIQMIQTPLDLEITTNSAQWKHLRQLLLKMAGELLLKHNFTNQRDRKRNGIKCMESSSVRIFERQDTSYWIIL